MSRVKGDNVIIKAEYVILTKKRVEEPKQSEDGAALEGATADADQSKNNKRRDDRDDPNNPRNRNKENPSKKVALKNRHQSAHPDNVDRLCSFSMKGAVCPFKSDCKYSHDVLEYLSRKEPDLGPVCYQYETFGLCSNGVMCRFGSAHIDAVTGLNKTRPVEEGGEIERTNLNVLAKDVQTLLRKKQYNRGEDLYKVQNGNKNKQNNKKGQQGQQKDAPATETAAVATIDGAANTSAVEQTTEASATASADAATTRPAECVATAAELCTSDADNTSCNISAIPAAPSTSTITVNTSSNANTDYNLGAYPDRCVKLVDFSNKVYIAPLTTVGNLPFRRILKEYGADITCGEMAMANNIVGGQASEWALMRKHRSENCFGVQMAGGYADTMSLTARILENEIQSEFVDLNSACPIDLVCNRGCGSALMTKTNRLFEIVDAMTKQLRSRSVTIKIRTGWNEKAPIAHELIPQLQTRFNGKLSAIMLHGRSRLQRYYKLANWDYILQAAQAQSPTQRRIPIIGNGDILSYEDWYNHQHMMESNLHLVAQRSAQVAPNGVGTTVDEVEGDKEVLGLCNCAMLARGALIKPWLPQEIKEQRAIDIPATERLDILRKYCNYGLEHWGSDQQGVNNTRRFLLEWMSFLHRYVPTGILEQPYAQGMNQRPPHYFGRSDLETLLASPNSADWIKISEMFLGPVPKDYSFIPKHKSNSYVQPDAEELNEG